MATYLAWFSANIVNEYRDNLDFLILSFLLCSFFSIQLACAVKNMLFWFCPGVISTTDIISSSKIALPQKRYWYNLSSILLKNLGANPKDKLGKVPLRFSRTHQFPSSLHYAINFFLISKFKSSLYTMHLPFSNRFPSVFISLSILPFQPHFFVFSSLWFASPCSLSSSPLSLHVLISLCLLFYPVIQYL